MRGATGKRGNSYYFKVRTTDGDGKLRQVYRQFKTRAERDAAYKTMISDIEGGSFTPASALTLDELIDEWLEAGDIRPTTLTTYSHFRKYLGPISNQKVQKLSPRMLDTLYKKLKESGRKDGKGLSPKSLLHVHRLIHAALNFAVKRGYVARNVASVVNAPSVPRSRMKTLPPVGIRRFIEASQQDRLSAAFYLLATSGLRRSELLGVTWGAVQLDRGIARIERTLVLHGNTPTLVELTKNDSSFRTISLDPSTVDVLRAHKARQNQERLVAGQAYEDSGLAFCDELGRRIHPTTFSRATKRYAGVSPHPLRHAYATAALDSQEPVDIKVLSERLGHSSTSITQDLYQGYLASADKKAAQSIADTILRATEAD